MRSRTTILLMIFFFGGLGALWWADRAKLPTANERRNRAPRVLPSLESIPAAEIRRVEIASQGGTTVLERREGGAWQIVSPSDVRADRSTVETLLTNLRELAPVPEAGTVPGPRDRYGLQPPARTVRLFADSGGSPAATLEIGKTERGHRYVVDPSRGLIEVVDAKPLDPVDLDTISWRERRIFPVSSFDVDAVALRQGDRKLTVRHGEGTWRIVEPYSAPADDPKVEVLVADLLALHLPEGKSGFVADNTKDLARYGLDIPSLSVSLTTTQHPKTPLVLHVGKAVPGQEGKLYARVDAEDDILVLNGRTLTGMSLDPRPLRSRLVAEVNADRCRGLDVESSAGKVSLVRVLGLVPQSPAIPGGWRQVRPTELKADDRAVFDYLSRVAGLHAMEFVARGSFADDGLDHPSAVVRIWSGDPLPSAGDLTAPADVVLHLGRHDPIRKVVFARLEGDPDLILLPDTALQLIPEGRFAFADRSILNQSLDDLTTIRIDRGGRSTEVKSADRPADFTKWRMTRPVEAAVDARAVASLAVLLSRMRAENIESDTADDSSAYGFERPWATVSWRGKGGTSGTLEIGSPVRGRPTSRFARVTGRSMVFSLGKDALAILQAELHDRTVLSFAEADALRLSIRGERGTSSWIRHERAFAEGNWAPEPGSPRWVRDPLAVDHLVKRLADLQTPHFVQYAGVFPRESGLGAPRLTVELELKTNQQPPRLRIGAPLEGGSVYATTSPEPTSGAVFLLPEDLVAPWIGERPGAPEGLPANPFAADR